MDHLALGAPWMIKEKAFFSSRFRRMATSRSDFSYWAPSSGRESDLDYHICLIDSVLVEPYMRGKGVGTRLIESLGDKRTDCWKRDPIFLMLKAYPIDGAWRMLPPGSKEQSEMLKMEQGRLYGFYKSLGFIADRDSFWMMHTPKALHNDTRERHEALIQN
jgi:GNAT superfamily N-acetyltransferase